MAINFVVARDKPSGWNWWLVIDDRKGLEGSGYSTQAKALTEAEKFREQVADAATVVEPPHRQAPPFKTTTGRKPAAKKAPARKAAAKKTPARKATAKKTPSRKATAKKTTASKAAAKRAPAKGSR